MESTYQKKSHHFYSYIYVFGMFRVKHAHWSEGSVEPVKPCVGSSSAVMKCGCSCPCGTWFSSWAKSSVLKCVGLTNRCLVTGVETYLRQTQILMPNFVQCTGWFWPHNDATDYSCLYLKGIWDIFDTVSNPPHQCDPLPPHPPCLFQMSKMAAYHWSSSTDLHLWFKCQESSPNLKCTVVIWLFDVLVWSQEWAVV